MAPHKQVDFSVSCYRIADFIILFPCMLVMSVYECHVDVGEDRRERESTGSLGAGAIGVSEPPDVGTGNQTVLEVA